MRHFLLLFLLFQFTISIGQQRSIDSLLIVYSNCKVDTAKIDILFSVAEFYRDAKPEKTVLYGNMALKIAKQLEDDKRQSLLLDMIGQGYEQIGDISQAIFHFNESFRIANNMHDMKALAQIKLNLGACYTDIGNYPLAIEYCKNSMEYFAQINDAIGLCRSEVFTSDALFKAGNPDDALYYLERAWRLSVKHNNYLLHYIYTNMGESYYLKKEYDSAKVNITRSMIISDSLNDLYAVSANYVVLAKVYQALGDITNAELFVKKGLHIAKESNIRESLVTAYDVFSKVLAKQHKFEEALKYRTLFMSANDSDQSASNNNIVQSFENERRKQYIAVIRSEEKQKDAELKRQRLEILITLSTLLVVIGISGYVFYSRNRLREVNKVVENAYKEIQKKQQEILRQNEELTDNNELIKQQAERIEELGRLKDRLFAIISHDLRSPFRTLKGMLHLLMSEKLSPDKFQTMLPTLVRGVSSTSDLVENLLSWSSAQLKGAVINKNSFDISVLVQQQIQLYEKQAADKKISLYNEVATDTDVFADKDMIDIVLRNLLANAIKFCYPEGKVRVTARQLIDKIEISISDEGMGIAPEDFYRIFQTKERYTTLGTNKEMGTGLGLLLSKDFVEKNKGNIGVESKVGVGSRFWITLPKPLKEVI